MSQAFSDRLLRSYPRSALAVIDHWRRLHPEEPVDGRRLDSGFMVYPGPDVMWGGCSGLGLDGPVDDGLFAAIDDFFGPRGHSPLVIASPYAHSSFLEGLGRHGFRPWVFRLSLARAAEPLAVTLPAGIEIREGPGAGTIGRGFNEGAQPGPGYQRVEKMFDASPDCLTLIAYEGDTAVGGGRLSVDDGLGLLFGASVLPEARRRGVQTALLRARIARAHALGCDTVVVETSPGGVTERNARRLGFELALTQMIFRGR